MYIWSKMIKTLSFFILLGLTVITSHTSCIKNKELVGPLQKEAPVSRDSLLQCYTQMNWDSAGIHQALISATWNWEFIKCYWNPEEANGEEYKAVSIRFLPNDSLEVKTNGQVTQTASWKISRLSDGYFQLSVSPLVYLLPGKIILCENRVIFYDSYTDGCDNYFKKED